MELHEVLLEMMDRGFTISKGTDGFILAKSPTETDSRKSIGGFPDPSQITGFANKGIAIEKYIEIKDKDFDAPNKIDWEVQVRFNIGLGPQIKEMASVLASNYEEATKLAKEQVDAEWAKDPEKKRHGYIQVKVRPKGF